ncbi:MAG TPA: hypothetical protein PKE20_07280, partial [Promineifilum sp.]|nr:hypothetical protein [Promineifilum sp.]
MLGQRQISLVGCFLPRLRNPENGELADTANNRLILIPLLLFQFEHSLESFQCSVHIGNLLLHLHRASDPHCCQWSIRDPMVSGWPLLGAEDVGIVRLTAFNDFNLNIR